MPCFSKCGLNIGNIFDVIQGGQRCQTFDGLFEETRLHEITLIQPYFHATESIGRRSYYFDVKATEDISSNEPSLD